MQRDLSTLVVARVGSLRETGQAWEPYVVVDATGTEVEPVAVFLRDLQAAGRPHTTLRSYALDLLRWLRFLWAVEVDWDRATRVEARDFSRWFQLADKPVRGTSRGAPTGTVNPVTGRPAANGKYAPRTIVHSETMLRQFYDFHRHWGSGPIINPFPLVRQRTESRANAHHNPMRPFRKERAGLYRPRFRNGCPARFQMSDSTSCSPRWAVTAIGRWWPSGCPPAPAPPNCWAPAKPTPTRAGS